MWVRANKHANTLVFPRIHWQTFKLTETVIREANPVLRLLCCWTCVVYPQDSLFMRIKKKLWCEHGWHRKTEEEYFRSMFFFFGNIIERMSYYGILHFCRKRWAQLFRWNDFKGQTYQFFLLRCHEMYKKPLLVFQFFIVAEFRAKTEEATHASPRW